MSDSNKKENQLQVFNNPEFGEVRTVVIDDEPWFVAADVCRALDIGNSRQAVTRLDDDEKNTVTLNDGIPGNPEKTVVNEPGLYSLVLGSRKPEAKAFKRWITHEVIPAIRKTGGYSVKQAEQDKTKEMRAEAMLKNADSRRAKLLLEIAAASHIDGYKEMIMTKTANMLAGEPFLPMPKSGRERHDLGWYCERIGKGKNWASPLGKILKKNGIKKEQGVNGEYAEDHARGDIHKQVQNFEWYADFMFPQLRALGFDVVKE